MEKDGGTKYGCRKGRTLGAKFSGGSLPPFLMSLFSPLLRYLGTSVGFLASCNDESMGYYPEKRRLRYISAIYRMNESCSAAK
jgi:hypothetical protein